MCDYWALEMYLIKQTKKVNFYVILILKLHVTKW